MSFFREIAAISEGLDLTIRIKQKNGKLTISVLPDAIDKVQPLLTTGTPEWLDENFIKEITKPLATAQGVVNAVGFTKSVEQAGIKKTGKPVQKNQPDGKKEGEEEDEDEETKTKKPVATKDKATLKSSTPPEAPKGPQPLSIF